MHASRRILLVALCAACIALSTAVFSEQCPGGCFIAVRQFPRDCQCLNNTCFDTMNPTADTCFPCDRPYGVYKTYEECVAVGDAALSNFTGVNITDPFPEAQSDGTGIQSTSCDGSATAQPSGPIAGSVSDPNACPYSLSGNRNWHDPALWGGRMPAADSDVTLPANTRVVLSGCAFDNNVASFRRITIPAGSQLIIGESPLQLRVSQISVQGWFRIGHADCRQRSSVRITFVPSPAVTDDLFGIQVMPGGQLEMFGTLYTPTWTRLSASVSPGSSQVQLQAPVNWRTGQQIFVTTSIMRDEVINQNEVRTITAVQDGGRTLIVDTPFVNFHYSGAEYSTEVGLNSRDIILESDASTTSSRIGAHVIIQGQARISSVMSFRMGQFNRLGRYPFHWHLAGDQSWPRSYITDSLVFSSYFRCVTLHATNSLLVRANVGFDITGHCFYLEDGVEEWNNLDGNLAAFVHPLLPTVNGWSQQGSSHTSGSNYVQPSDAAASGFYISNARNTITNNAASGGVAGFSFPILPRPTGVSRNQPQWASFNPSTRPVLRFEGNTAHSSGYHWQEGGCIYFGGQLTQDDTGVRTYMVGRTERSTVDDQGRDAEDAITNTRTWLCNKGLLHWGKRVTVTNYQAHDIMRGIVLFGSAWLSQAVLNRASSNWAAEHQDPTHPAFRDFPQIAGFQWYDTSTRTIITDTRFQRYTYRPDMGVNRPSAFLTMTHSDVFKPSAMSYTARISYEFMDRDAVLNLVQRNTGSTWMFNWVDLDGTGAWWNYTQPNMDGTGSLTWNSRGEGVPSIIGSSQTWWLLGPDCWYQAVWGSFVCPTYNGQVSPARLDIRVNDDSGNRPYTLGLDRWNPELSTSDPTWLMGYVAHLGFRGTLQRRMPITRNEGTVGVTGSWGWYVYYNRGAPRNHQIFVTQVPPMQLGQGIFLVTRYPPGTTFRSIRRVFRWYSSMNRDLTVAPSWDDFRWRNDGTMYWWDGRYLWLRVTDPGNPWVPYDMYTRAGINVQGSRWFDLWYDIRANCWAADGYFCQMQDDPWCDMPTNGINWGGVSSGCSATGGQGGGFGNFTGGFNITDGSQTDLDDLPLELLVDPTLPHVNVTVPVTEAITSNAFRNTSGLSVPLPPVVGSFGRTYQGDILDVDNINQLVEALNLAQNDNADDTSSQSGAFGEDNLPMTETLVPLEDNMRARPTWWG